MTDEDFAAAQAAVNAEAARRAKDAADARAATLKPLTDLLASDAWIAFRAQIGPATTASVGEPFYDQVQALDSGNLAHQVSIATPAAVAAAG